MKIRLAEKPDVDALVEFNLSMAMETEGKKLGADVLRPGVEAVFEDNNKGFYVVADDNGPIAGGLLVTFEWSDWRDKWFWWIQSVYIRPEYRGQSLYRQMYDHVKQLANANGEIAGFRLYVEKENDNARKVYERVGMLESHYLMYEEEK